MRNELRVPLTGPLLIVLLTACANSAHAPTEGLPTSPSAHSQSAASYPQAEDNPEGLHGKIAFVAFRDVDQEVYIMNADGSDERNLSDNTAEDYDPDISEDGQKIVFVSDRSGQAQVWMMSADGSGVTQLTDGPSGGQAPRWSRDGTRIAYASGGSIAVMKADGSASHVIMESQPEQTAEPCRAGAFPGGWSPDDRLITYYSASVSRESGQVCTITAGGTEIEVLVDEADAYTVEPVFSPDGSQIVYRGIIGGRHDIWLLDINTRTTTNLTDDADLDIEPDWSPDGEWIAFGSLRPGAPHFDLFVMRPDGSDVRQLTNDPAKEANPVWAP